jgi:hypothetical protein
VSDFRDFASLLDDTAVKVTNNNFRGLSQLCEEFHFRDFDGETYIGNGGGTAVWQT